jgi:hypothetical protein
MYEAAPPLAADPCGDTWWHVPERSPAEDPVHPVDLTDAAAFDEMWAQAAGATTAERLGSHPGGVLAAAVEDATDDGAVAGLADTAIVEVAVAAQRLLGWAMGAQLQAVAELARRWEATPLGERAAVEELALACGVSEYAMSRRLDAAVLLPSRLPRVWAGLVSGHLEWAKAWEILDKTMVLSNAHADVVEDGALAVALGSNLPDLRAYLARAIAEIDPEGAAQRARDAHARRGVSFRPGPDSTATMALTAGAAAVAEAEAALNRLTLAALDGDAEDTESRTSDPHHREVTRADVLLGLIQTADADLVGSPEQARTPAGDAATRPARGSRTGYARTLVQVNVPLSTLLALTDHPGELPGYGSIPAAMARELISALGANATWRCAVTDDRPGQVHGTLLALGRPTYSIAYTPTATTRDFATTRDGTCRFPGCRRQAGPTSTDLDHRVPWRPDHAGGVTCECNLQSLCQNHHRLKHETRFSVSAGSGGLTWTTPTGRSYHKPDNTLPHAAMPVVREALAVRLDPDPAPF